MNTPDPNRWRELAELASQEQDPTKLNELAKQMCEIFRENDRLVENALPDASNFVFRKL